MAWGVRNRLYGVRPGEKVVFPEIPCSFDDESLSRREYFNCVTSSLHDIVEAGLISPRQVARFFVSALIARSQWRG